MSGCNPHIYSDYSPSFRSSLVVLNSVISDKNIHGIGTLVYFFHVTFNNTCKRCEKNIAHNTVILYDLKHRQRGVKLYIESDYLKLTMTILVGK